MTQEIIIYKCNRSYSSGSYYAPYNPFASYQVTKTIEDVNGLWYSIITTKHEIINWVYEHPIEKWRYIDETSFELHDDLYNWFLMRWS